MKNPNSISDTDIIEWLNRHATVLGIVHEDGETEYLKIEAAQQTFREIATRAMKRPEDNC